MKRTSLVSCLAILALGPTLAACGDDPVVVPDAGRPDSGVVEVDAGPPDSGPGELDAGQDGGPVVMDATVSSDAGDPFGDAGPLGTPPWVPLEIRADGTSCDPLVPCGGDEVGTWDVAGGCLEFVLPTELTSSCPDSEVTRAEGQARGRVVFDGTSSRRVAQSEVDVDITIRGTCASLCDFIEPMIMARVPDSSCAMSGDTCVCTARTIYTIDDSGTYTIEGNEIVSGTKRWAYCIDGTDMRYEDVSPAGEREPGIIELTER